MRVLLQLILIGAVMAAASAQEREIPACAPEGDAGDQRATLTTVASLPRDWPLGRSINMAATMSRFSWPPPPRQPGAAGKCRAPKTSLGLMVARPALPVVATPEGKAWDLGSLHADLRGVGLVAKLILQTAADAHYEFALSDRAGTGLLERWTVVEGLPQMMNATVSLFYVRLDADVSTVKTCGINQAALACLHWPVDLRKLKIWLQIDGRDIASSAYAPWAMVSSAPDLLPRIGTCQYWTDPSADGTIALAPTPSAALWDEARATVIPGGNFSLTLRCPELSSQTSLAEQIWLQFMDAYALTNDGADLTAAAAGPSSAQGVSLNLVDTDTSSLLYYAQDREVAASRRASANRRGSDTILHYKVQYKRSSLMSRAGVVRSALTYTIVYR